MSSPKVSDLIQQVDQLTEEVNGRILQVVERLQNQEQELHRLNQWMQTLAIQKVLPRDILQRMRMQVRTLRAQVHTLRQALTRWLVHVHTDSTDDESSL